MARPGQVAALSGDLSGMIGGVRGPGCWDSAVGLAGAVVWRRRRVAVAGSASRAMTPAGPEGPNGIRLSARRWRACPGRAGCFRWVAAPVEAIATLIALPSCWEVLSSPEASPASCFASSGQAADRHWGRRRRRRTGPGDGATARPGGHQKCPCTGTSVAGIKCAPDRGHAERHHRPWRDEGDESSARARASATEVTEVASQARPGMQGRVAQHLLHVEGADEDEGVGAGRAGSAQGQGGLRCHGWPGAVLR